MEDMNRVDQEGLKEERPRPKQGSSRISRQLSRATMPHTTRPTSVQPALLSSNKINDNMFKLNDQKESSSPMMPSPASGRVGNHR